MTSCAHAALPAAQTRSKEAAPSGAVRRPFAGNQARLRALAADRVVQRSCDCGGCAEPVQRKSADGARSVPRLSDVPEVRQSQGTPLPLELAQRGRTVFGADLSDVTVHTGGAAQAAAAKLHARAFTVDRDIYFGAGYWRPESAETVGLVGHELAHVVQQRRGLSDSMLSGRGDAYEQEADRAGVAFRREQPMRIGTASGSATGIQRSEDNGAAAAQAVAVEESPYGLPFLGEAMTYAELVALMDSLSAQVGAPLGLVKESIAMSARQAVAANDAPAGAPGNAAAAESPASAQASSLDRPLQMSVVAGCVAPVTPNLIGMAAHAQIEATCAGTAPGCRGEYPIPGDGRCDMLREHIPAITEIGEIKPASWLGAGLTGTAATQLAGYLAAYTAATGAPAGPMWSYVFPPEPFSLDPAQMLTAWGPAGGLYFYRCAGARRQPVREPVVITNPIPVTNPQPTTVRDVARGTALVGAGIGIGYLIYRGVRMIPSLFPALWPTIPLNLVTP